MKTYLVRGYSWQSSNRGEDFLEAAFSMNFTRYVGRPGEDLVVISTEQYRGSRSGIGLSFFSLSLVGKTTSSRIALEVYQD